MKLAQKISIGVGGLLIMAAVGLAGTQYYYLNRNTSVTATSVGLPTATSGAPALAREAVSGYPVRLEVPSLGLDLQVVDGVYNPNDATWTLSKDKVHYALPTQLPNDEAGNTLLYGHYRREVFASMHTIQLGAQAVVTTENGHRFTYTFEKMEEVQPQNTSVFQYSGEPRLTIQTCSGAWFQNRQLFYFSLTAVDGIER